jgi:hypothetical protein
LTRWPSSDAAPGRASRSSGEGEHGAAQNEEEGDAGRAVEQRQQDPLRERRRPALAERQAEAVLDAVRLEHQQRVEHHDHHRRDAAPGIEALGADHRLSPRLHRASTSRRRLAQRAQQLPGRDRQRQAEAERAGIAGKRHVQEMRRTGAERAELDPDGDADGPARRPHHGQREGEDVGEEEVAVVHLRQAAAFSATVGSSSMPSAPSSARCGPTWTRSSACRQAAQSSVPAIETSFTRVSDSSMPCAGLAAISR